MRSKIVSSDEKTSFQSFYLFTNYSKDIHGSNWVGDGPEYCKYPKLIIDKARVNLNQLIDKVEIGPINGIKELVYPQNQSYWKISHIKGLGFCYTFFIPDTRIKKEPIRQLGFQMKSSVNYMVHSPGSISKKDVNLYNITDIPLQNVILHYEVYHMLDYNNQPCQEDPHYLQDKCIDDLVFKESMERVNCTWPFVKNDNHICTEKESAKEARQIGYHISTSQKRSNCSHPCNYLEASFTLGKQEKYRNMIKFHFPESIKAHTAYFAYSILSLIAEVGGYVGLFLGWSIYQITDWLDLTIDSLKKKLYVS